MTDLYHSITERIIRALESSAIPWQFPWKRCVFHAMADTIPR